MNLFDVYPLFDITPVKGEDCHVWDDQGNRYLDLYGGHAVISIGHSHPHYIDRIGQQLRKLGFYSNSIQNPLQVELAEKLGQMSCCEEYSLFLCNSGAEATENALKLASFHTGRKKVIAFKGAFHGRTSAAVAITDDAKIQAPINDIGHVSWLALGDIEGMERLLATQEYCAVIIEGIQGIGGIHLPGEGFLEAARVLCDQSGTLLVLDEIQSGYGRSGRFFAHQYTDIRPDVITIAKGMGNGFPVGGVLIAPHIEAKYGMLGTTFGGNHLACAASLAVLEVMEAENLVENAAQTGAYLMEKLATFEGFTEVRGLGLMVGIELPDSVKELRGDLLNKHRVFTGSAKNPNVLRVLPPLTLKRANVDTFLTALAVETRQPLVNP
jgi:acetylornithine/N-succinyldiaminopimelate aminotransferase